MKFKSETRRRFPWILIALALPALAVLISLGTWQMQRLSWKEDLLAKIEAQLQAAAIHVTAIADDIAAGTRTQDQIDYLPAVASGVFDHAGEAHFFATHKGISGYYIFTPLLLSDRPDTALFINRGFVPFDLKEPAARPETLIKGQVTVEGLARQRLDEKPSSAVPNNDLVANIYYWKDLSNMAAQAGFKAELTVLPFFLDAGFPDSPGQLGQWPVDGVTMINLPNNHLQYAVTWYGLALTLIIIVGLMVRRAMSAART